MYEVYDRRTGFAVRRAPYKTLAAACRAVDRLDLAYGAVRYGYRRIEAVQ